MPRPRTNRIALLLLLTAGVRASSAQPAATAPIDLVDLVRRSIQHQLDSAKVHHPQQYVVRRIDERRDSTKVIIETAEGDVARLVAIDGKPLRADADQAELARLETLAQHPELQERRRRNEEKDRDRTTHLLSLLPDALQYTFVGTITCGAAQCYRLRFAPNPHWVAPDIEANIFRGLAGELWIDPTQLRMVRLQGRFIEDVDFGLGFIGRLNKGGDVLLQQAAVNNDDWELTGLTIRVSGRALLFKSFTYRVDEQASRFTPVAPSLHYRDAIELLNKLDLSSIVAKDTP